MNFNNLIKIITSVVITTFITSSCFVSREKTEGSPLEGKCQATIISTDGEIKEQWCAWRGYWWFCRDLCYRKEALPVEK